MALLRAGALQLQSGSNAIRPAEESWHGTVCRAGRLAGAELGLCRRRRRQGDLGRQVHLHPGGDRCDHPHEGARGGAHRSGERSLVGLALARAAEAGPVRGLPRRSARQGGARPAAEQVRPQRCPRPGADRAHGLVSRSGGQGAQHLAAGSNGAKRSFAKWAPFPSEVCMCKFLTLLLAVAALAFGPYTALAQGQLPGGATAASFAVIRNGEQIGTSTVRVQHSGGETTVETTTDIRVTIAYITVYRFAKRQTEQWVGSRLAGLSAVTDDNGKMSRVIATRYADRLSVNVNARIGDIEVVSPANLWDTSVHRLTRALNTTDGTLIPVSVMDRGMEQIVARGRSVAAHRYSIKTTDVQDVWYDGQQRLLKVELRGSDGLTIVHELS